MITQNTYAERLHELSESAPESRFVVMQQSLSPLKRCTNTEILNSIIDPTTGHPYEGGIICEGEFASIDQLNNNNRYYSEDNYLEFVELLKHQIHSPKGLYGELEHPKSYQVDSNNISHKILDIWYDKSKKKVYGIILILATPKGLTAQQIIKSGGQIAVSARGGGAENKNPNGSFNAILKLLVTFDIVYHPGFSTSLLDFANLNESEKAEICEKHTLCIYETNLGKLDSLYEDYQKLNECRTFIEWAAETTDLKPLFESQQSQQQRDQKILEKNQSSNQDELEDELEDAVDQQLTENEKMQINFFGQVQKSQLELKKKILNKADTGIYDNSAGFIDNPDSSF